MLLCNRGYKTWDSSSQARFVTIMGATCDLLYRPGPGGPESMKRKKEKERERERAGSPGLHGKQIKPMYRTCTIHGGTGHLLNEVLKVRVRKWAWQASMLWRQWRQKEGRGEPRSLEEQGYFISRNAGLYIFSKNDYPAITKNKIPSVAIKWIV